MFFVLDSQERKKKKIRDYLRREPMIAVILAAVDFEWTVGRCILFFLAGLPTWSYVTAWQIVTGLISTRQSGKRKLTGEDSAIPPLAQVVKNWQDFKDAFNLRHRLIHGRGTCSRNMATGPVEIMLAAVDDLYAFADSKGIDPHDRLPVRWKKR
jgi:hypothetical protein